MYDIHHSLKQKKAIYRSAITHNEYTSLKRVGQRLTSDPGS